MSSIVEFLTAQYDAAEACATQLQDNGDHDTILLKLLGGSAAEVGAPFGVTLSLARFLKSLGPDHVLADIAAKRRILELHQFSSRPERWGDLRWPADADTPAARDRAYGKLTGGAVYSCATCDGFDREEERVVRANPWCDTLLALVAPCAEHPDYNQNWRP